MATISGTAKPSTFSVFRNRSFTLLWSGEFISTTGSALTSLAASILVYRLTNSALSVGLMLMASALPSILFGLVAGVFVDRYNRKMILIASDLIRAVLSFLIPFVIPYNILWLYVIIMFSGAIGQFYNPAHESVLPELASDEELASANSLMAISSFGSTAIGFAASGLIASRFPIEWAFFLDAISFVFSAACVMFIPIAPMQVEGKTNVATVINNLKAGGRYLFESSMLRSLFIVLVPIFASFGLWNSLLLPFAIRALHATTFEYGLQEGLTSVGFVLGSLVMARLGDRLREGQWVVISYLGMGVVGIYYGFISSVPLAIGLVIVSGFLNAPSAIARRLVIQRNTQREVRGRVNSTFFVARDVINLLGMAAAGLADIFNVRALMIVSGVIIIGAGLMAIVIPGLGQPAAEWKRAIRMLRSVKAAPGLGPARAATVSDFDLLAGQIPALATISAKDRQNLAAQTLVSTAEAGTAILRQGDKSDAAYFILDGRVVAGRNENGQNRVLEVLNTGDFFGEIAALTGVPRTADVVAEKPSTLLQIPVAALRKMMAYPQINQIFLSKMTERMFRMNMVDLPRMSGLDSASLRELRTPEPALTGE
jgi:DHA3 family macrolide efflux protein-like MFS transporter